MCQPIVSPSMWDMAAGLDRQMQGRKDLVKTADGRWWYPTAMTPAQGAAAGVEIQYRHGDEICPR